jgi:hypothetical protein
VGNEHEHSSKKSQSPTRVRDVSWLTVDLNRQSHDRMTENYGLKIEVLYASKLGCAKIIPTKAKKISE